MNVRNTYKISFFAFLLVASSSATAKASSSGIPLVLVKGESFSGVARYRVQRARVRNRVNHSSFQMNSLGIGWR